MPYQININETQRLALMELIKNSNVDETKFIDPIHGEYALKYWLESLQDLPAIEEKHPGVLHGFCI